MKLDPSSWAQRAILVGLAAATGLGFFACGGDDGNRSVTPGADAGGAASGAGGGFGTGGGQPGGSGGQGGAPDASAPPLDLSCLELNQLRGWAVDPSAVAQLFTVTTCDGVPVPACERDAAGDCLKEAGCLCETDFLLSEDDQPISVSESGFGIQESRGLRVYVTLALDMSNSTSGEVRTQLIEGAKQFIDSLPQGREVFVGIQLFDGSINIDNYMLPIKDPARVKAQLDSLANYVPRDGASTNLYGGAIESVSWLQQRQQTVIQSNDNGVVTVGYLVLFTDGADTAGRTTMTDAQATIAQARSISGATDQIETSVATYAVALRSADFVEGALQDLFSGSTNSIVGGGSLCEDTCSFAYDGACDDGGTGSSYSVCTYGSDCTDCGARFSGETGGQTFDGSRYVFEAADETQLAQSFRDLGQAITSQLEGTYLLAYCSPKRSGVHRLTVDVADSVSTNTSGFDFSFDATGFTGGCSADFLANSCGDPLLYPDGRCGGFNCGACDEERFVCDPLTDNCIDACLINNSCSGQTITNSFGYSQSCAFTDIAQCSGMCVDVQTDTNNCGQCGNYCPAGSACLGGVCDCPGADIGCFGTCYDPLTTSAHCGSCGNNCGFSATCQAGTCVCTDTTQTFCDGACIDVNTNAANCGACGKACAAGTETCVAGACECTASYTDCSGQCVDPELDVSHCGGCGNACARDQICQAAPCVVDGGVAMCGSCVDGGPGTCADAVLAESATVTQNVTMPATTIAPYGQCIGYITRTSLVWRAPAPGAYTVTVTGGTGETAYFSVSTTCGGGGGCFAVGSQTATINATTSQRDYLILIESPNAGDTFSVGIAPAVAN